jgi:adenylate kinase
MSIESIIRKNQKDGTKIGIFADKIVSGGNLLPDEIVNEMIKQEIIDDNNSKGFIFNGFPKTAGQAKMLDQFLHKRRTPINTVIHLDADKHIVKGRVLERGKSSERKDDTSEIFETRWATYNSQTLPALNYFNDRGKVIKINGEQYIDDVYSNVKTIVDGLD